MHGREPTVWFDKACIDQRDIGENLACLPVFLAGCRKLLITCGPTWSERLWCVLELFVHLQMGKGVDDIELLLLSDKPPPSFVIPSFPSPCAVALSLPSPCPNANDFE